MAWIVTGWILRGYGDIGEMDKEDVPSSQESFRVCFFRQLFIGETFVLMGETSETN